MVTTHRLPECLTAISKGLIVSCVSEEREVFFGSENMVLMAKAAREGGAVGLRANGPQDIAAIRGQVELPLIGIYRARIPGFTVNITPTIQHALEIGAAGADMIEVDATQRPHPDGLMLDEFIRRIKAATGRPVLADVSTAAEGLLAQSAGADAILTTLAGQSQISGASENEPDFTLIRTLSKRLQVPLIARGRIHTPEVAKKALDNGAYAIIVGSTITRPQVITERFVRELKSS